MTSRALRLMLSLLPVVILCPVAPAQPAACSTPPLNVDEAIAALHQKSVALANENRAELRIVVPRERITGVAVLRVEVDTQGRVIDVTPLSGPKDLTEIYEDQEKRASFSPFKQNGVPVCAQFVMRYGVSFNPRPDGKAEKAFWPSFTKCAELSVANARPDAIDPCERAANAADLLSATPQSASKKQAAYSYYATALMRNNRAKEALPFAEKAVATADLGFDDILGKAAAYGVRGQARGLTGDLHGADRDFQKAEDLDRAALDVPQSDVRRSAATRALKSILIFHAGVLSDLGENPDADKLRDEAKKL